MRNAGGYAKQQVFGDGLVTGFQARAEFQGSSRQSFWGRGLREGKKSQSTIIYKVKGMADQEFYHILGKTTWWRVDEESQPLCKR